jgi:hypothetical protein
MTAKSRYWDHERCAWVTYETAAAAPTSSATELPAESLPEQRADIVATAAPTAPATTP